MVHLSAGHLVHGHKAKPGRPIPNNYAYWGGNVVKDDRPDPVIITLDVKMLRERKVLLLQTESYAVLSKHVLPPECIIRIEDMDGKDIYNRKQEREQKLAYLARRRILQEEGEAIASVPEPEPTPRVAPPEPPASPKNATWSSCSDCKR